VTVNLEEMRHLTTRDQWVYVVGRIAVEAVDLDAQLRALRTVLAGESGRDATLAGPAAWSVTMAACQRHLATFDLDDRSRAAIGSVLDAADTAWQQRNRYLHDLLVDTIQADEDRAPVAPGRRTGDRRLQRRLSLDPKGLAPNDVIVSLSHAVDLVLEIVAVGWRLRSARGYVEGSTMWSDTLFGHITGNWDGSADFYSDDEDD
jgi:hypothetical protein